MGRARTMLAGLAVFAACGDATGVEPIAGFRLEDAWAFPEVPAGDFLTRLAFDGDGALWVTTFEGTIFRIDGDGRTAYDATEVVGTGRINDLFVDASDRAWVAAGGSLAAFEDGAWAPKGPPDFMGLDPRIAEVAVSPSGEVLLGAGAFPAGGLLLLRDGTWRAFTPEDSDLPGPLVHEIEVDAEGRFWVASGAIDGRGGLIRVDGDGIGLVVGEADGLLYDYVDALAVHDDRIYVGYEVIFFDGLGVPDGGLQAVSLEGRVLDTRYPFETGLTANRVRSLAVDDGGDVWFTTGLDEDRAGCEVCFAAVGVLDIRGAFTVLSSLNSDLEPNAFLPSVRVGPDGAVYVVHADRNRISRVVR